MDLFELIPIIEYGGTHEVRNIFYKYYLKTEIDEKFLFSYRVSQNESLESIAYDQYTDTSLWWILAIINDIRDPLFELPVSESVIQAGARDQATIDGVLDVELYAEIYDQLDEENDNKRVIKVVKPEFMSAVLAEIIKDAEEAA
jgi:hypothetical protein